MKNLIALTALAALAACGAPPQTPAQKAANRSVGYEVLLSQCTAHVGGFGDARDVAKLAKQSREEALRLGATPEDFAQGRNAVNSTMIFGSAMVGDADTCGALLSSLATLD